MISIIFAIVIIALIAGFWAIQGSHKLLWGAYVGLSDGDLTHNGDLAAFESLVGKPVDIQAVFIGWEKNFPATIGTNLAPAGKTLLIYWLQNGISLDDIIAGKSDAYINQFAADVKSYGGPVVLAPLHEMNGDWNAWSGAVGTNTPAKVIAAWKHIHDAFMGILNVKFAWAVNNGSVPDTPENAFEVYYPGDAYVDYVGVDGFNFANPWMTWDEVFPASLMSRLAAYRKPILISSMGSDPGPGQAQWISDMGTGIKKYPQVMGWVWFNQSDPKDNFLVDSSTSTLAAFKAIIPK